MSFGSSNPVDVDVSLIADVCRLHFVDELTKSEIADKLRISRFKVADLVKLGKERGIVKIAILDPRSSMRQLEERLAEAFGLEAVAVSAHAPSTDLAAVGTAGADLLLSRLRDGDTLGIGWGTSVFQVVRALQSRSTLPRVDVVQLAGGVDGLDLPLNAIGLATAASLAFNGRLYALHAPAFVDDVRVADALRQEESLRRTFQHFSLTDVAVVGIGGWKAGTSSLRQSAALSSGALKHLRDADVRADVLMHFTDFQGAVISGGPVVVGPTLEEFTAIRLRLAVAAGTDKLDAIGSALRSGLVNALATDAVTAAELLSIPARVSRGGPSGTDV